MNFDRASFFRSFRALVNVVLPLSLFYVLHLSLLPMESPSLTFGYHFASDTCVSAGARYSVARLNAEVTTGKEGIELVESKDYVDEKTGVSGRYTKKVYHLESRVPGWVKLLAPASALKLDEESWDAFPSSKTVITNRFFGERFSLSIESRHFDMDKGERENALELPEDVLKKRVVQSLDIGVDQPTDKNEYKESEDPRLLDSKNFADKYKPLSDGWKDRADPYMCCYKVVTILFKIWGVQGKGENFLMDMEGQIFLKFHKEIFCWLDDWYGLSMEEVIAREAKFYGDMEDKLEVEEGQEAEDKKKKAKKGKKGAAAGAVGVEEVSASAPTSPLPSAHVKHEAATSSVQLIRSEPASPPSLHAHDEDNDEDNSAEAGESTKKAKKPKKAKKTAETTTEATGPDAEANEESSSATEPELTPREKKKRTKRTKPSEEVEVE